MKNNKKGLSLLLVASMLLLCGQPAVAAQEDAGLLPASEYALEEENVQGSAPEENIPAGIEWEETAPETTTGSASEENALEALTGSTLEGKTLETVELPGEGLLVEENVGNEGAEPVEAATEAAELPVEGLLVEEIPEDASEAPEELTTEEETELLPAETEVTEEALFEPEDETEEMTEATLTAGAGGAESAVTIAVNKEYTDYLTDPKDENWYRFTLPVDGYVTLTFSHKYFPDSSYYWKSYICDSNTMHSFTWSFKGSVTSETTYKLGLSKGSHYLKVIASDKFSISDYRVKINYTAVSFWETEHNGSSSLADPIAVNTVYTGSAWGDDEDWYRFSLDSAGYVSLSFSLDYTKDDSSTSWYCYLYDSNSKELVRHYFSVGSGSTVFSATWDHIGLPAGNYYLKIYCGYSYKSPNNEYRVRINYTRSAVWETEFNDTSNSADTIALNTIYSGNLMHSNSFYSNYTDDVDWYRFTLASAGEQMLRFEHGYINSSSVCWQLTLYNSALTKLETKLYVGNITSSMDWYHLSAGTYYIKVEEGEYRSTGDYRFRIGPHTHSYQTRLTRATLSTNGRSDQVCSCGDVRNSTTIYHPSTISLSATSYTYTGKAKKPSVTVWGSNGSLIAASNYTVSYPKGRANVGKYKVSITFKGNYSGTVSRSFTIHPAKTKLKKLSAKSKGFTVNWTKKTKQVSGYQVQYSLYSWFYSKKTKTVTKNTTTSLTLKGLKAKQRYYVRIRTYKTVSGKKYYSSWSSVKSVTTKK